MFQTLWAVLIVAAIIAAVTAIYGLGYIACASGEMLRIPGFRWAVEKLEKYALAIGITGCIATLVVIATAISLRALFPVG